MVATTPRTTIRVADSPAVRASSKAARTRVRILDATATVLSREGYAGMRLSEVAAVADLQTPAIYYYFSSREELIEEVMWVGIAGMRANLEAALDALPDDSSPRERILVAVEAHLRHELEISEYATAAIRNTGQVPAKIRGRQLEELKKYGQLWRALVNDAVDDGVVRPELDAHVARMLIIGALNWTAEWWDPQRAPVDVVVRNAQDLVRHGLFAPGP